MKGSLFISLEGPDGSGKSTQAYLLSRALRARGYIVTGICEPGGTPLGEQVRTLLFTEEGPPGRMAMALLLAASRAQVVEEVIRPALAQGDVVIADRYADSTLAYQAYGQGLDVDDMRALARMATGGLTPDLTLYVDVSEEVSRARMAARLQSNKLDKETASFHARVRFGYERLIAAQPERWVRVRGDAPIDAVHSAILKAVEPALARVMHTI